MRFEKMETALNGIISLPPSTLRFSSCLSTLLFSLLTCALSPLIFSLLILYSPLLYSSLLACLLARRLYLACCLGQDRVQTQPRPVSSWPARGLARVCKTFSAPGTRSAQGSAQGKTSLDGFRASGDSFGRADGRLGRPGAAGGQAGPCRPGCRLVAGPGPAKL